MAEIYNEEDNAIVTGTKNGDTIHNTGKNVRFELKGGDDYIEGFDETSTLIPAYDYYFTEDSTFYWQLDNDDLIVTAFSYGKFPEIITLAGAATLSNVNIYGTPVEVNYDYETYSNPVPIIFEQNDSTESRTP